MKTPAAPVHPGAFILLVDDNPHGLIARRTVLAELGYRVLICESGAEALEVFATQPVDLLITDFRMPNMDGVQLITRIRQARPDLPIILLSGFVEPLGLTEQSTGADVVLSKSAGEVGFLVRSVRRLLSRQPLRKPMDAEGAVQAKKVRNAG
jgi:CheY-like chemotaxis protein